MGELARDRRQLQDRLLVLRTALALAARPGREHQPPVAVVVPPRHRPRRHQPSRRRLPAGWTTSAQDDDEEEDDDICDDQDPFNEVEPVEEAESSFEQGSFGPFLTSVAGRYTSTDEAQRVIDALADAVDQCQTFTEVDDDGTEMTYTFSALSFPKIADDTFAARLSGTTPIGPLAVDFAFARDDDVVVAIINGGLGAADTALTESMLRLMADRL